MALLNTADAIRLGAQAVDRMYAGTELVWVPPYNPLTDPYNAAILAENPMAYWPLDERAGATARELVNGWDGEYIGGHSLAATPTPDGANLAAIFNGSTGCVRLPNTGNRLQPTPEFAVEMWFRVDAYDSYDSLWGWSANNWDFRMDPDGAGGSTAATAHWYGTDGGWGNYGVSAPAADAWTDGEWHHLIISRSSANGVQTYFYDGAQIDTGSVNKIAPRDQSGLAYAYAAASGGGRNLGGALSRFAFWDRTLTATDAANHYTTGTA